MPKRRTRRRARRKTRRRQRQRQRRRNRSRKTKRRRRRSRRGGLGGMEGLGRIRDTKEREAMIKGIEGKDKQAINWEHASKPQCRIGDKGPHRVGLGRTAGREHHCRTCGQIVCDKHSKGGQKIYRWQIGRGVSKGMYRSCDDCAKKEKEAIDKVKAATSASSSEKLREKKAIQALRRAMFENCDQKDWKGSRETCRIRPWNVGTPRLPDPEEIRKAISFVKEDNSAYGSNTPGLWNVKSHIDKLYPPPKKEKEKEELLAYRAAKVAGIALGASPKARGRAAARDR